MIAWQTWRICYPAQEKICAFVVAKALTKHKLFPVPDLHSSSSPSESHLYNLHQNSYNKITLAIRAGYRRNGGNYVRAVEKRCI